MRLILGSQSPRREEILRFFSLPFIQISSGFDESLIPFEGDPKEYVSSLASHKALSLIEKFPTDLILTADTVVYFNGQVLNKPTDVQEAFEMLKSLSGNWHEVTTGISLYFKNKIYTDTETTRVRFNSLSDEQIALYQRYESCLDKAGGYAIQGSGGILVAGIEGCYYNVMGLPINLLQKQLLHANIDLWKHLK